MIVNNNDNTQYPINSLNNRNSSGNHTDIQVKKNIASNQAKIKNYNTQKPTAFFPKVVSWIQENLCCCLSLETIRNEHETEICCFPSGKKNVKSYDYDEFNVLNNMKFNNDYARYKGNVKSTLRPLTASYHEKKASIDIKPNLQAEMKSQVQTAKTEKREEQPVAQQVSLLMKEDENNQISQVSTSNNHKSETMVENQQKTESIRQEVNEDKMTDKTENRRMKFHENNISNEKLKLDNGWMRRRIEPTYISTPENSNVDASARDPQKNAAAQIEEAQIRQKGVIKYTVTDEEKAKILQERDERAIHNATRNATIEERSQFAYEGLVSELKTKLPKKAQ